MGLAVAEVGTEVPPPAVGTYTPHQLQRWADTVEDPWAVATIREGYKLQFRRRPPAAAQVRHTIITDQTKAAALDGELETLLKKSAIEPVTSLQVGRGFYSTYFLVPKKTGDLRPILDLRSLNKYLKVLPFKMLTTTEVLRSISPMEWFTSVDLKDAYFHVPIARKHRPFLRFAYRGRHWQFKVLPFGLSLSPRVFTRCVTAALGPLRSQGIKILTYLDDWLVCARSAEEAAQHTSLLLEHIASLGLRVNVKKSNLSPRQVSDFIGITLNSVTMTAKPVDRRIEDILTLIKKFKVGNRYPLVRFLSILGKLTSVSMVVPLGLLRLRPAQRWLNSQGLDAKHDRLTKVTVDHRWATALTPWTNPQYLRESVPLGVIPDRREVITTDASGEGWGATWQKRAASGLWTQAERREHINVLELRAVHLALQRFLPHLRHRHVLIRTDNTTVVYHINRQGGVRSAKLLTVARRLLLWASQHFATLRAVHLPGIENAVADHLSRHALSSTEWSLHPQIVDQIWTRFGRATVDLYATDSNSKCFRWFTPAQDALAQQWPQTLLYAFPPIPLIWPTLQRTQGQHHTLILVVPYWTSRPWFPLLQRMALAPPWRLPPRRDLLSQLQGQVWHPAPDRLKLSAWLVGHAR